MSLEIGKRYCHYKNKKEYTVIAIGYFTESDPLLECVVYRAEYTDTELGENPIFIRPREMFEEYVIVEGIKKERFSLVS